MEGCGCHIVTWAVNPEVLDSNNTRIDPVYMDEAVENTTKPKQQGHVTNILISCTTNNGLNAIFSLI